MQLNELQRENMRRWIWALGNYEYAQGKGELYDSSADAYCCLGVACELLEVRKEIDASRTRYFFGGYISWSTPEPDWMMHNFGISVSVMDTLVKLNDDGVSFAHIAEILALLVEPPRDAFGKFV